MSRSFASNSCAWNYRPVVGNRSVGIWRGANARQAWPCIDPVRIRARVVVVAEVAESVLDALEIARLETVVGGAVWNRLGVVSRIERGSQSRNGARLVWKRARRCWHCWQLRHSRGGSLVGRRSRLRGGTSFSDRVGGLERAADHRVQNVRLNMNRKKDDLEVQFSFKICLK